MRQFQRLVPLLLVLLVACSQSPVVETATRVPSPSGTYVADVETLDNGLGFGLGRLIEEVHVVPSQKLAAGHGDRDASVVFWVDATEAEAAASEVRWVTDESIEITYDKSLRPGKMLSRIGKVALTYRGRG